MKWMMMFVFFFYNIDKAFADSAEEITTDAIHADSIQETIPFLEKDNPYLIMKDLHVFSLRIPPRYIYSAGWKTDVDVNDPQLCKIGVETHREKQNVYTHCDVLRQKTNNTADIATTDLEDL